MMFNTIPGRKPKKIYRSFLWQTVGELLTDMFFKKVNKKSKIIVRTIDGEIELLSVYWDNKGNLCLDVGEDYEYNPS